MPISPCNSIYIEGNNSNTGVPVLTKAETDYIDQYLGLTTLADGQAGLLVWEASPPRTKLAGKLAGSLDRALGIHRVKIAGRRIPTVVVLAYLACHRVPTSAEISTTPNPSVASLKHLQIGYGRPTKLTKIGKATFDLGMLDDQAYIGSELQKGIKYRKSRNRFELYLDGEYVACFERRLEAIIARAAFRLKEKLAAALRKEFGAKSWSWGWPVMSFYQGKYIVVGDGKRFETPSRSAAIDRYVLIYKETRKRKIPMKHNYDSFAGIEEFVNYDIESGTFSYKSGKIGNPVFLNGDTPSITYNGNRLSAARVVWFICKGYLPKEPIKPIDGNAANLSIDNLTVEKVRRQKGKIVKLETVPVVRPKNSSILSDIEADMALPPRRLIEFFVERGDLKLHPGDLISVENDEVLAISRKVHMSQIYYQIKAKDRQFVIETYKNRKF